MRYRIKKYLGQVPCDYNSNYLEKAEDLKFDYGLDHLYTDEVIQIWKQYSDIYASSWLHPTKEHVEKAFLVELEIETE